MVNTRRFFESRLRRYGNSPRTLDWSPTGQLRRFEVLSEVGDLRGREVLDLGCGLGHLYDYLAAKGIRVSYRGLDLSPKLVTRAREIHPDEAFDTMDVTSQSLPWKSDYALASGVLNLEIGRNETAMRRLIRSAFDASRAAAAVNMLSVWADRIEKSRHYYDPIRMMRFAGRLTRRVVLRHDYMPHDFTLYLYHEAKA